MTTVSLGVIEPFGSPVWRSNLVIFRDISGVYIPESESKEYISRACRYARHYEVYLVPERFMLMGYQCLCIISPEGKVLGAQKCVFWNFKTKAGKRSTTLEVISTEFGGIALCVDVDIYRPEFARVAFGMGAQIIICSQQIAAGDYNSGMVVTGVWSAAQNNHIYVIGVSDAFNCVCAPKSATPRHDGFLVTPNTKIPMTAQLQVDELSNLPPKFCLSRKFYAVHRSELV